MLVIVATALLLMVLTGGSDEVSGETWNVDDDGNSPGLGITALTVGGVEDFLSGVEDFLNGLGPFGIVGLFTILVVVVMFILAIMNWKNMIFVEVPISEWGETEKQSVHWDEHRFLFVSTGMLTTLGIVAWVIEFAQPEFGFFHSFVAVTAVLIILRLAAFLKHGYSSDGIWKFLAWATGPLSLVGMVSIALNYRYEEWDLLEKCEHGLHAIALSAVVALVAMFVAIVFYFYLIKPKQMLKIDWTKWEIQFFPTWLFVLIGLASIGASVYGIMKGFGIAKKGNTVEEIYFYLDSFFGYEVTIPQTDFKIYLWYVFLVISSFMAIYMAYGLAYTFHMWVGGLHNSVTYFFVLLTGLSIVFAFEFVLQDLETNVQGSTISIVMVMTGVNIVGWCYGLSFATKKGRKRMRSNWIVQLLSAIGGGKVRNEKKILDIWLEALDICESKEQIAAVNFLGGIVRGDQSLSHAEAQVDRAMETLIRALENRNEDTPVRKEVVAVFWSIGNEKTAQLLEGLTNDSDIGMFAREAVENMRRKAAGIVCSAAQKEVAEQLGIPVEGTTPSGIEFILVPAGTFIMGSEEEDNATPHRVTISKPFYMGKYQVTQLQWMMIMGSVPSNFTGNNRPVEKVSWDDCQEFIQKLNAFERANNYRMPTEAEWEYACRAGSTTKYCFGNNEEELMQYAWTDENCDKQTWPVGLKKPNNWGLYDMHGNVWEWCQDWCDENYYQESPVMDPGGPSSGPGRVIRGGGWISVVGGYGSALRIFYDPKLRPPDLGFRLIRSL